MAQSFEKDPDEVLDYDVDFSSWLTGTDVLSSVTWTVASGITKASQSKTDSVAKVWLSGGTVDTDYAVECKPVTAHGRTVVRTITIKARDK